MSAVFTMLFFGNMQAAQVVFYFFYIGFAVANISFHTCSSATRVVWVRNRLYTIYLPFALVVLLLLISLGIFLSVLDGLNETNNNAFPIPEKDATLASVYVVITFTLYLMPVLFMGISFVAYA